MERYDYQRQLDRMKGQIEEMRGRMEQMMGKEAAARAHELAGKGREAAAQMGEMAQERPVATLGLGLLGLLGVSILTLAIFSPRTFRRFTEWFFDTLGF